ncbi:MAG: type I-MYXAN CRISPR-associated protein Cas6/Cmx6 [Burkholderiales bacterium]|nr:type I-MYXAN CRISPR-associated protein Cas6/Cmx6 [Burkholderiales bacterium]
MKSEATDVSDVVDVAFSLRGATIPADHGWHLFRLLSERLDWLADEPAAGVHPIRGSRAVAGLVYLGPRARLMLRLPRSRADQSFALSGARMDLGDGVEVGVAHLRPLFAHSTLYSQFVTTGSADEAVFQRDVSKELQDAGIGCKVICGRMRRAQAQDAQTVGFSLMLHELAPEDSLRMQAAGLGAGRKLGCGIFVPHKSAAAVGA